MIDSMIRTNTRRLLVGVGAGVTLVMFVLLGGCGKHEGELGWLHEASQPDQPYRVVRSVSGTASSTVLVGYRHNTLNLYERARENLIENAELKPGQRLINRTKDEFFATFPPPTDGGLLQPIFTMFRVYSQKTVILSGDVVVLLDG